MPFDDDGHPYHFKAFGIPVQVGWQFWMLVLFGMGANPVLGVMWAGVLFGSVLFHELGHAFAYRAFGCDARIRLWAFGGLTYGSRTPARWQEVVVVGAGPIPPLVLIGIPSLIALRSGVGSGSGLVTALLWDLVFANLFMSVFNLLPVMPLDGGRLVDAALGRAAGRIVSALVGLAVAGLGLVVHSQFIVIVGVAIGGFNLFQLANEVGNGTATDPVKQMAKQARKEAGLGRRGKVEVAGGPVGQAWHALELGDTAAAAKALGRADAPSPLLVATVRTRQGDRDGAVPAYAAALLAAETGPAVADEVLASSGVLPAVTAALVASTDERVPAALRGLHDRLIVRNRPALAAPVAEALAGLAPSPADAGATWYLAAQAWGRSGEADQALRTLERAAATGHATGMGVAADPAFSTVFDAPGFAAAMRTLGSSVSA